MLFLPDSFVCTEQEPRFPRPQKGDSPSPPWKNTLRPPSSFFFFPKKLCILYFPSYFFLLVFSALLIQPPQTLLFCASTLPGDSLLDVAIVPLFSGFTPPLVHRRLFASCLNFLPLKPPVSPLLHLSYVHWFSCGLFPPTLDWHNFSSVPSRASFPHYYSSLFSPFGLPLKCFFCA